MNAAAITALAGALTELALFSVDIAPILKGAREALSAEDFDLLESEIDAAHKRFDEAVEKRRQVLGPG